MPVENVGTQVNALFQKSEWEAARKLLKKEQVKAPEDHWVLTQLGVTYYEQRHYAQALPLFLSSLNIVPDCPLTLWHLAGTLDALDKPAEAIPIYVWLLENKTTPKADPCWESEEWKASLQADCMFSLAVCFQKLDIKKAAQYWFRQYLDMLLLGVNGSYAFAEVMDRMRSLRNGREQGGARRELRHAVDAALQASGIKPINGRRAKAPKFKVQELLGSLPTTRGG